MATTINRTPFNALKDDDGTQLYGTLWDKTALKNVVLDPVDAALAIHDAQIAGIYDTVILNSTTGTQTAYAPGLVGHTLIQWTGNADLAIYGITGGVRGQRITFRHSAANSAIIYFQQNSGGAAAGTRISNLITSGPTPIGTNGWATYLYDGTFWCLIAHDQGPWIGAPFVAGNYSADVGTVTINSQASYLWKVSGRTLFVNLDGISGTASGSPTMVKVVFPIAAYTSVHYHRSMCLVLQGGSSFVTGNAYTAPGFNYFQVQCHGGSGAVPYPNGSLALYGVQLAIFVT